jgi:hypothetical protein
VLRTYVPGDLSELERQLVAQGISEAQWSRLVHF